MTEALNTSLTTKILGFLEKPGVINGLGFRLWRFSYVLRQRLIPSWRRAKLVDEEFDRKYGLETGDWINLGRLNIASENLEHGTHYEAVSSALFGEAIAQISEPLDDFIFIDFGSGKGRALLLATECAFKKVTGVEFSSDLHQVALQNIETYKRRTGSSKMIESICMDATSYEIPADKGVYYFFNPFDEIILERVINNIETSLRANPRTVYILYCNPIHIAVVEKTGFSKIAEGDKFALFKATAA